MDYMDKVVVPAIARVLAPAIQQFAEMDFSEAIVPESVDGWTMLRRTQQHAEAILYAW
jgi:hypothetical protein